MQQHSCKVCVHSVQIKWTHSFGALLCEFAQLRYKESPCAVFERAEPELVHDATKDLFLRGLFWHDDVDVVASKAVLQVTAR